MKASSSRFSPLLRWVGITLVVLLCLQMAAVLTLWQWQEESFRQLVVERLINQSPMALIGLLLMYLSARLEDSDDRRPPVLWVVCVISGLMAVFLTASLPVSFGGDQILREQAEQQLASQRGQLEVARQQSKDPQLLKELIARAEAAGQVPANASEAEKTQAARAFLDRQLEQLENQVKKAEQTSQINLAQRRYSGSFGAIVLIVAFTILCLGSVL